MSQPSVQNGRSALASFKKSPTDPSPLQLYFLETCQYAVDPASEGRRVQKVVANLKAILGECAAGGEDGMDSSSGEDLDPVDVARCILADTIWLLSAVHSESSDSSSSYESLCSLARGLAEAPPAVPLGTLLTTLDEPFLEAASLIEDASKLRKTLKKINTDRVYKQKKYNLLRESSEGYSKVVHLLSTLTSASLSQTTSQIKKLIGYFDLDPNRVLDLAIDALEVEPEPRNIQTHVSLIGSFEPAALPHLLGFKLSAFVDAEVPFSLLEAIARLIKSGLLQISQIFPYLQPDLAAITDAYLEGTKKFATEVRSMGVVSLNATSTTATSSADQADPAAERASPDKEAPAPTPAVDISECPMLLLVAASISVGDMKTAEFLIGSLRASNIDPFFLCPTIGTKLSGYLSNLLDLKAGPELSTLLPILSLLPISSLSESPILYTKLCRLFASYPSSSHEALLPILSDLIVPTISLFGPNPAISFILWEVLEKLPYETRYKMYDKWKGDSLERKAIGSKALTGRGVGPNDKSLHLVKSEVATGLAARAVLKRLSKDNYAEMGKKLAKATHDNPIVVFNIILSQIESYDNMIPLLVDSFRYLTPLSLDVLSHSLLCSVGGGGSGNKGRSKLKSDGINAAQWLSSVEQFIGVFYNKFPEVELRGLLTFVISRLENKNMLELGIVNALLSKMGGLETSVSSLSSHQLEGRAGGPSLRRETTNFGVTTKINTTSCRTLREVLSEPSIGLHLLVLTAQIRNIVVFQTETTHLKFIGNLYDTCTKTLTLLVHFIATAPEQDNSDVRKATTLKYSKLVPSLLTLTSPDELALDPEVAFAIARPLISGALEIEEALNKKRLEIEEGGEEGEESEAMDIDTENKLGTWLPSTDSMRSAYQSMMPAEVWNSMSVQCFETFWSLSLYDIHVPKQRYEAEISRLKKDIERVEKSWKTDREKNFTKQSELDVLRMKAAAMGLRKELSQQQSHCRAVRRRIDKVMSSFFSGLNPEDVTSLTAQSLLTNCIYRRCLLTPEDAMFCAKFIQLLHSADCPHFPTKQYFEKFMKKLIPVLLCVTEGEAANLGVLLKETWSLLGTWRFDKKKYESEVMTKKGFSVEGKGLDYESFTKVYNEWHEKLGSVAGKCLQSSEYIHVRAALIVLSRIVEVYPTQYEVGQRYLTSLKVLQADERQDLKAMANAYVAQLSKARDSGLWRDESGKVWRDLAVEAERLKAEKHKTEATKKAFESMGREMKSITQGLNQSGDGRRGGFSQARSPSGAQPLSPAAVAFTPAEKKTSENVPAPPAQAGGRKRGRNELNMPKDAGADRDDSRGPSKRARGNNREAEKDDGHQQQRDHSRDRLPPQSGRGGRRGGGGEQVTPPNQGPNKPQQRGRGGPGAGMPTHPQPREPSRDRDGRGGPPMMQQPMQGRRGDMRGPPPRGMGLPGWEGPGSNGGANTRGRHPPMQQPHMQMPRGQPPRGQSPAPPRGQPPPPPRGQPPAPPRGQPPAPPRGKPPAPPRGQPPAPPRGQPQQQSKEKGQSAQQQQGRGGGRGGGRPGQSQGQGAQGQGQGQGQQQQGQQQQGQPPAQDVGARSGGRRGGGRRGGGGGRR